MGKSTVAACFVEHGVPVADTDAIAREVVTPGSPALAEIATCLGREFILPDGNLDRPRMASRVFGDKKARKELEAILHPRIRARWQSQLEQWQAAGTPLAVVVIPLLYETGTEPGFDRVICVACSPSTQRHRLVERGWSADEIERRNAAQLPITEKLRRADCVVWSEGGLTATRAQVKRLLERFESMPPSEPTPGGHAPPA